MVEVKEMPIAEKYERVLGGLEHDEYVPGFIRKHLGEAAAAEYQRICETGIRPIPEEASVETKYEIAYENWMWISSNAFSFVREHLGEEGIEQMLGIGVEQLKKENADPTLYLLGLIRAISPGGAFQMVAKKSAYEFQWITPYTVEELSRERAVLAIPQCKILDYPGSEDICRLGCMREYPQWMAEQLKVRMEGDRRGTSCTITLTPLH